MSQAIVIPCYNEFERLPKEQVTTLLRDNSDLTLYMVDDGSKDQTFELLQQLAAQNPRIKVIRQSKNQGKAEAVRTGLVAAINDGHACVGYADADFATPAHELTRLLNIWNERRPQALLASRIRLLGSEIERQWLRHYLGRIFATFASLALRLPVYDTQCGAKFFAATDELRLALTNRFESRWVFDVELIGRLCAKVDFHQSGRVVEVPLQKWMDIKGSKLRVSDMVKAAFDLFWIALELRRSKKLQQ